MKGTIIKGLSVLINITICVISAIIILYIQDWFGSGDIYSMLIWTFSLAIGLAVSGPTIVSLYRSQNKIFRIILILLSAAVISIVFFFMVSSLLVRGLMPLVFLFFIFGLPALQVNYGFLTGFSLSLIKKLNKLKWSLE